MDSRKIGTLIKQLRIEKNLTQQQLADKIEITDRAVSKWERGEGCPDISLIKKIATILEVQPESLLSGEMKKNTVDPGKLIRTKFYICPDCGEILTATGKTTVNCCGRPLEPCTVLPADAEHEITVSKIDDEFYITFNHAMEKEHYVKFIAYVNLNTLYLQRLYPEQSCEARMPILRGGKLLVCCSKHGLFMPSVKEI